MINLNQLRAFYYVAKHSSHTIAAEKLFISQPAVTAQIKLFENFYDMKLFKKTGRRLILTHLGELLFEQAERIFKIEDKVENILSQIKELNQGLLELGCTKAYAKHIMPSIISVFHRAYPKIKIILQEGSSMTMIKSLLEFENEVVVVAQMEVTDPKIQFIPFSLEEIVIILPVNHPLNRKKEIEFNDIALEPVIMRGQGSGTRKKIMDLYKKHNATPNIFMESNNTEFIMNLVERGDGISFLVKPAIDHKTKEKKLISRSLKNTRIFLNVSFAYIKNTPLSPAAKAFFDVFKNSFIEGTPRGGIGSIMAKILAEHPQNE
ncbi:LysR family transcriptional regulator [Desulfobacula toluolica]|uniref:Transcriptional regulator, LysR family n=1 Tax=Desulfobacula toluolica (strain DSM 7467 / Tol2) TaxID=651182 RepID=K0NM27_DESTT|nr:LysR family transcriptional regulator [Desulfobacula toluolica]CCK79757.1 transcriptional regulator, LysR family [Desulfobacula toluolica Tol2]